VTLLLNRGACVDPWVQQEQDAGARDQQQQQQQQRVPVSDELRRKVKELAG
jgi:hypothetical protein